MEPSDDFQKTSFHLRETGKLYVDLDFCLPDQIAGVNTDKPIKWRRPQASHVTRGPVFISDGISRLDIRQGALPDCYFLSALASIAATNKLLFARVVPHHQTFGDGYTGLFYFNFWKHGSWVEVWVDDQLPYVDDDPVFAFQKCRSTFNEFWVALVEKAYAKLKGGYDSLRGGYINEALVDLTGGISEKINLAKHSEMIGPGLFNLLVKTTQTSSLMGCSIESEELTEEDMGNGLFGGHSYSITGLVEVVYDGVCVQLIRLRNPWGHAEWKGPWSDKSREWHNLSEETKSAIGFYDANDGEFWMTYIDWLREFDELSTCHLTPDAFFSREHTKLKAWKTLTFHGEWVSGLSAGGCGNKEFNPELFWTNPQYKITIKPDPSSVHHHNKATVLVSLTQKTDFAAANHFISFKIFKVTRPPPDNDTSQLATSRYLKLHKWPKHYTNVRDVTGHFTLEVGVSYVIIPSTYDPGKHGEFLLRVFIEN